MCRLLAANSAAPIDAGYFRDFSSLCDKSHCGPHGDGWGIVVNRDGSPEYLGREPQSALAPGSGYGAAVSRLSELAPTGTVVAHLRHASMGDTTVENTHPFVSGAWAFAHNGTLHKFAPDLPTRPEGTTDSERLFRFLLPRLEAGGPMLPAMVEALRHVRSATTYTSLTCVFTDGPRLFAIHDSKDEAKYGLKFQATGSAVAVCQEPIWPGAWRAVENQHMLVAENGRLKGVLPLFRM